MWTCFQCLGQLWPRDPARTEVRIWPRHGWQKRRGEDSYMSYSHLHYMMCLPQTQTLQYEPSNSSDETFACFFFFFFNEWTHIIYWQRRDVALLSSSFIIVWFCLLIIIIIERFGSWQREWSASAVSTTTGRLSSWLSSITISWASTACVALDKKSYNGVITGY